MANTAYRQYKLRLANGVATGFDTIDLRAMLVMTNTTALTDELTAVFVDDIATLDEYDGASYARQNLTVPVVALNGADVEVDVVDFVFPNLGAGTRQAQALLLYEEGGSDAANRLIGYVDTGGFPFTGTGVDKTMQVNVAGLIRLL